MPQQRPQGPNPAGGTAITAPFTGLHLDRPPHLIPPTGLQACSNVRISLNEITNKAMGWTLLIGPLNGPVCGGTIFALASGTKYLLVATPTDIYAINNPATPSNFSTPVFITPVYTTGTAATNGTAVTGAAGTLWNTSIGSSWRNNARPGDQISFGSATQNSPTATWFTISAVNSDTSLTLTTSAGVIGAGAYTLRQCLANNTTFNRMRFEEYIQAGAPDNADIVMAVNGGGSTTGFGTNVTATDSDPIFKWNPANTFGVYLSALAFTGALIRRFQNVMVVGALIGPSLTPTVQNFAIASSANGLPTNFSTGIAFQGFVSDTPYYISHLGILGNSLMIYGGGRNPSGTIVSAQFVGFPTIWQFSTVVRGHGTFSSDSIMEFADRHEFFHYDGMYRYNGLFIQVMNDHIFRNILQSMSLQRNGNWVCIPASVFGDIIWAIPLTSDPGGDVAGTSPNGVPPYFGFVEHYMEQANSYLFKPFTMRDAPFTAYIGEAMNNSPAAASFGPGPIVGDVNGNVYVLYGSDTQNGTPFTSSFTFADRVFAGERARGLIKRVYPHINTNPAPFIPDVAPSDFNVSVTLKLKDRINGPVAITDTQTIDAQSPTQRFTTHFRRGRVANVTFSTTGGSVGTPFHFWGYDWELPMGSPGGKR